MDDKPLRLESNQEEPRSVSVFSDRRELINHVEAAIRRERRREPAASIQVGALHISPVRRVATWRGRTLPLTGKEYDILVLLAEHPDQVLSRTFLYGHVWSNGIPDDPEFRGIDRHIVNLRRKLEDGAKLIQTVRGTGYRLVRPEESAVRRSPGRKRRSPA